MKVSLLIRSNTASNLRIVFYEYRYTGAVICLHRPIHVTVIHGIAPLFFASSCIPPSYARNDCIRLDAPVDFRGGATDVVAMGGTVDEK